MLCDCQDVQRFRDMVLDVLFKDLFSQKILIAAITAKNKLLVHCWNDLSTKLTFTFIYIALFTIQIFCSKTAFH